MAAFLVITPDPNSDSNGRLLIIGVILVILGAIVFVLFRPDDSDADMSVKHPVWLATILVSSLIMCVSAYFVLYTANASSMWVIALVASGLVVTMLGKIYLVDTQEDRISSEEDE